MMRFHYAYERAVVPPQALLDPHAVIYAARMTSVQLGVVVEPFFDVVFIAGQAIRVLSFIRRDEAGWIFPRKYLAYGERELERAAHALAEQTQAHAADAHWYSRLGVDADLDSVLAQTSLPTSLTVPGISSYAAMFLNLDRYAFAVTRANGRAVLDLNPQAGFGLHVLSRFARSVAYEPATDQSARLIERLNFVGPSAAQSGAELVVALGVSSENLVPTIELAQRRAGPDAHTIISAQGDAAKATFEAAGMSVRQVGTPAFGGTYDEWFGVLEPRPFMVAAAQAVSEVPAQCAGRPLRIAFLLRPSSKTIFGGDVVQVRKYAEHLQARGHQVAVLTDPQPQVDEFEIVVGSNITGGAETAHQMRAVAGFAGPVGFMSIYTDHMDEAVWGMRTAFAPFSLKRDEAGLREGLDALASRSIALTGLQPPPARNEMEPGYEAQQREILSHCDFIIANALSEVHRLKRYLAWDIPFAIAPSAVDPQIYGPDRRNAFVERYNVCDFILTTGRFEPRKNQLLLFEVARLMPERLFICIGKNYDLAYGHLCRAYWPDNVQIFSEMPEVELAGAIAASRVTVLPSWDEVVSLSSLNAAISEPALVLTRNSYEHEYLRDGAEYCDPADYRSIAAAIERALQSYEVRVDRRRQTAQEVRSRFTWANAAQAAEAAFYEALQHNPRGEARLKRR